MSQVTPTPILSIADKQLLEIKEWLDDSDKDKGTRLSFVSDMEDPLDRPFVPTSLEQKFLDKGALFMRIFDDKRVKRRPLNTSPLLKASVVLFDGAGENKKKKRQVAYGMVTAKIRGTTPKQLIAYFSDNESIATTKYEPNPHVSMKRVLERVNNHHVVQYNRSIPPQPFAPRGFVNSIVWIQSTDDPRQYMFSGHPTDHAEIPFFSEDIRGETTRVGRLTQVGVDVVLIDYIFDFDFKGDFPSVVTERVAIPGLTGGISRQQLYFMHLKELSDFDEGGEDAAMLGQLLFDFVTLKKNAVVAVTKKQPWWGRKSKEGGLAIALRTFFIRSAALRKVSTEYSWFESFILQLLTNKVQLRITRNIVNPLSSLSHDEACSIGKAFAVILLTNSTPIDAVNEFILSYPVLQQLDSLLPIFRPLLVAIAKNLLIQADWGMKFRVLSGAAIEIMDMVSDMVVIHQYMKTGQTSAAYAMIAMIGLNITSQIACAYFVNTRKPKRVFLREACYVLLCVKPGVDALKFIRGGERDPLVNVDPVIEMNCNKIIEAFFEGIPAGVVQTILIIKSKKRTLTSVVSLLISLASICFTATSMSYDYDTSVEGRRLSPVLRGYVPDVGRGLVFFLMFLLSMLHASAKIYSTALLAITNNWNLLIMWILVDQAAFLFYKVARGDLIYFITTRRRSLAYFLSTLVRVVMKLVTDYTGAILFSNPYGE